MVVEKLGHREITVFCYCSCFKSMPNKIKENVTILG